MISIKFKWFQLNSNYFNWIQKRLNSNDFNLIQRVSLNIVCMYQADGKANSGGYAGSSKDDIKAWILHQTKTKSNEQKIKWNEMNLFKNETTNETN